MKPMVDIEILLVEDSPHDVELTLEALKEARFVNEVQVARDGVEALAHLRKEGKYADCPRPDLVLLDLNMPRKDGREVLEEIKADPDLRTIPVVVLTTSAEDRDVLRAYDHHVNAYVQKPLGIDAMIAVARTITDFWIGIVRLPPADAA